MDAEIGRLLDGYERLRRLDDALVLLTADHGESMIEHELWFSHGHDVYEEVVRVPLMVRGPGVERGRYRVLASGVDLAPTILRFAGAELPGDRPGYDLRRGGSIPSDRAVFVEAWKTRRRAVVQQDSKWLVVTGKGGDEIVDRRFYDLASDPEELEPRAWPDPDPDGAALELVEQTLQQLEGRGHARAKAGKRLRRPKISPRVTPEQREKLRALGYVE